MMSPNLGLPPLSTFRSGSAAPSGGGGSGSAYSSSSSGLNGGVGAEAFEGSSVNNGGARLRVPSGTGAGSTSQTGDALGKALASVREWWSCLLSALSGIHQQICHVVAIIYRPGQEIFTVDFFNIESQFQKHNNF